MYYFLTTTVFFFSFLLSSTLPASAHNTPHSINVNTEKSIDVAASTPTSLLDVVRLGLSELPTKTVVVTLTHTVCPSPSRVFGTSVTDAVEHFDGTPSSSSSSLLPTVSVEGIVEGDVEAEADEPSTTPPTTPSQTANPNTPLFTLDAVAASSPSIPSIGHYTFTPTPTPTRLTTTPLPSWHYSASAPRPSRTPSDAQSTTPSTPSPIYRAPPVSPNPAEDLASDDDGTAWAGMDNAIPAQMQDNALEERVSEHAVPSLAMHGKSAVVRRGRRVQARARKEVSNKWGEERRQDGGWKRGGVGVGCQACEVDGESVCRGDVAVGVCRGRCVEVRFLGRGRGNGCED